MKIIDLIKQFLSYLWFYIRKIPLQTFYKELNQFYTDNIQDTSYLGHIVMYIIKIVVLIKILSTTFWVGFKLGLIALILSYTITFLLLEDTQICVLNSAVFKKATLHLTIEEKLKFVIRIRMHLRKLRIILNTFKKYFGLFAGFILFLWLFFFKVKVPLIIWNWFVIFYYETAIFLYIYYGIWHFFMYIYYTVRKFFIIGYFSILKVSADLYYWWKNKIED